MPYTQINFKILINSRPAQTAYPCELRQVDLPGRIGGVGAYRIMAGIFSFVVVCGLSLSLALGVLHS